jgi:parallel beta-helix repeat protein
VSTSCAAITCPTGESCYRGVCYPGCDAGSDCGEDGGGIAFSLRANGGLESGQSTFDGKEFLPLVDYLTAGEANNSDEALQGNYSIQGTTFPELYQTETWLPKEGPGATFTFAVPNGDYTVHLHFVDWANQAAGERVFHVDLQGQRVLEDLDIFAEVGQRAALVESFDVSVDSGELTLEITTEVSWPEIAGVEIVAPQQPYLGQDPATDPPAAPSDLTATADSASSVELSWTDNADDETSYEVEWRRASDASFGAPTTIAADSTTHRVTGLQAETEYVFRVAARNAQGSSDYSGEARATTQEEAPFVCPGNTCIFVSNSTGDDSHAGDDMSAPWKTLSQVNSANPQPGTHILFQRGDEWEGTLTVPTSGTSGSPVTYGAYGTGPKPKLYGSSEITGWTLHSGDIYKASFPTSINQLFVDGERMKVARTPNSGYFDTTSVESATRFTADSLDANIDYTGARWFGRMNYWLTDTKDVVASSSKTLTLDSEPTKGLAAGKGFFLLGKLEFLDSPGEWAYDDSTNTVYLWAPNGDSPANHTVRGSVHDYGVDIEHTEYVNIEDLELLQHSRDGVRLWGADFVEIDGNTISYPAERGISAEGSDGNTVTNNSIVGPHGHGMWMWTEDTTISDNEVLDVGVFEQLGFEGTVRTNGGTAMEISGDGNTISYNRIIGAHYNGIFWRGESVIEHNFIKDTCLVTDDGGGIYTGGTTGAYSVVRGNIILNTVGTAEGSLQNRAFGNGIYIDTPARHIVVEDNTIAHSSNGGIYMHENSDIEVRNNTIMDARYGVLANKAYGDPSVVQGNVIYAFDDDDYVPNQLLVSRNSSNHTFDDNTYINHYNTSTIFKSGSGYQSFSEWQNTTGQDAQSTFDGSPLGAGESELLVYNDTKQAKTISLGAGVYTDVHGNQVTGSVTLQPFTSMILVGN